MWLEATLRRPHLAEGLTSFNGNRSKTRFQVSFSTNVCSDKLEETSDLKMIPESFCGPQKTLWPGVFYGPWASNCPALL